MNVATEYMFGVSSGSMFNFDLRNKGVDAETKVGRVECKNATGAIEKGSVQLGNVWRVPMIDRGWCVDGVRMSFVRAISSGARRMPAMPAADTATSSEASGEGELSTSSPPALLKDGVPVKESPGSGRESSAEKKDRTKEVIVDERIEYT